MPTSEAAERSFDELVAGALARDQAAWRELCGRLKNVAWKTINTFRMSPEDADDAFAATFFRLFDNLEKVRDPAYLPGWIARTAHNESVSILRSRNRFLPIGDRIETTADYTDPAEGVLDDELRTAVLKAFGRLSERCQRLLRLLTCEPPLSYEEVAALLGTTHGSLGPTRGRCLESLRSQPEVTPFLGGAT